MIKHIVLWTLKNRENLNSRQEMAAAIKGKKGAVSATPATARKMSSALFMIRTESATLSREI